MKNIILVFLFVCILRAYYCIEVPYNPCPSIFRYVFDGKTWSGHILVAPPPLSANIAYINASFSIPGTILEYKKLVLDDENRTIDKIENGQFLKFISVFPKSKFLPQVTNINWNGKQLCSGPSVDPPSTWYSLTYTYKWSIKYSYVPIDYPNTVNSDKLSLFTSAPESYYTTTEKYYNPPSNQPIYITPSSMLIEKTPPNQFQPEPVTYLVDSKFPVFPTPSTIVPTEEPKIFRNYKECGSIRRARSLDKDDFVRRIINGTVIPRNAHPWLTALFDLKERKFFCAGNLISNKHVLTAAHCVLAKKHTDIQVRLGVHNTHNLFDPGTQYRMAKSCLEHPEYKEGKAHSDIAFLVLESEIQFTNAIKPICLWNYDSDFNAVVGYIATIMGWGKNENGETTSLPMKTDVTIRTNQECRRNHLLRNLVTDQTFCAGARGSGPCLGDSGGGLFISIDGKWYLRGIISTSVANRFTQICDTNSFSIYVDTAKYMDWIVDNMEND